MSDLKEFLDKNVVEWCSGIKGLKRDSRDIITVNQMGLFFWERGGKQFVQSCDSKYFEILSDFIYKANDILSREKYDKIDFSQSRDFLDCLACLGEERVKGLIMELEAKE